MLAARLIEAKSKVNRTVNTAMICFVFMVGFGRWSSGEYFDLRIQQKSHKTVTVQKQLFNVGTHPGVDV